MEKLDEVTEKYLEGEDQFAAHVPVRHKNRNTSKGDDNLKGKETKPESDKTPALKAMNETSIVPEELPGVLTKEIFTELASYSSDCCISILLGKSQSGNESVERYDVISFKNALQKTEEILKQKGIDRETIANTLAPGYNLVLDENFWKDLTPGLAIFISDGFFKYIKMPVTAEEEIVVEASFYVTPLIPLMERKEYFYLLVISKNQCKLFKADNFGMRFIPVEGLSGGLSEEIGDTGVSTTFRAGGSGGNGGSNGGANFHGIGGGNNNDDKAYLANYFDSVDDIIWKEILHNENVPLVLAGVEYLIPIYKSASDYKNIYNLSLTGNHEHVETNELYNKVMELMQPYFEENMNKAIEMYGNQSATALTSSIADDVIPAAYYGRISHLFVQKGEHLWGSFDEMENKVSYVEQDKEGAEDLMDNAVVRTLQNGGEIFLIEKEKMPADSSIAAIFRY